MITTPHIVRTEPLTIARIQLVIPRAEIQSAMGPAIKEVYAALAAQGIAPGGPWLAHHHRKPTDTFDFDVCVPAGKPVSPSGRVTPGSLPSRPAVRTVYAGPYEGLSQAWTEFEQWVEGSGHTPAADGLEVYTVHPGDNPDPSAWRTELNWFLIEESTNS